MGFGSMVSDLALGCFVLLLAWAAWGDIRHYEIPNWLCASIAGLFPLFALGHALAAAPLPWGGHLAVSGISFLICFGLFAAGVMGGGDAKLIPAVGLWAGPGFVADFLIVTSLAGGALALAVFVKRRLLRHALSPAAESARAVLANKQASPLPYGVAIAIGGLTVAASLFPLSFSAAGAA